MHNARTQYDPLTVLKWGGLVIIGIVVFPWIYKYINKQTSEIKEQNQEIENQNAFTVNQDSQVAQETAQTIVKNRPDIWAAAESLAHDLGTAYSNLNPRSWTENDTEVADTIIYQRKNFVLLERLYQKIYTPGNNLRRDLLAKLDKDQLQRIRKYIKI